LASLHSPLAAAKVAAAKNMASANENNSARGSGLISFFLPMAAATAITPEEEVEEAVNNAIEQVDHNECLLSFFVDNSKY